MKDLLDIKVDAGDEQETTLSIAHMLRGKIITHFSHVEFMFADLHFRAMRHPSYNSLSPDLPYRVKSRVEAVKKIVEIEGPIKAFTTDLLGLVDDITKFEELRQFMAHGNMLVDFSIKSPRLIFIVYDQPKSSGPILKSKSFSLQDLSNKCIDVGRYSDKVIQLLHNIFTNVPLPAAIDLYQRDK